MTSNIEIEYAQQVIIDCAEDLQSEDVYPNTKDSKFWKMLNCYTYIPGATKIIEKEFGYERVKALIEEGFDLANRKIDNYDCQSCNVVMINGTRCHETGCPEA